MTTLWITIHVQTHENAPPAAVSIPAGTSVSDFLASCGRDAERLAVLDNPVLPVFQLVDGGVYRLVTGLNCECSNNPNCVRSQKKTT